MIPLLEKVDMMIFLKNTQTQLKNAILQHPIEIFMITLFAIPLWFIDFNATQNHFAYWIFEPILFTFIYLCRNYRIYPFSWIAPLLAVLTLFFINDDAKFYLNSPKFYATNIIMLIILCGFPFSKSNQTFIYRNFTTLFNTGLAIVVGGMIMLLGSAIFYSIEILLNIDVSDDLYRHFNTFSAAFFIPLFFLMFQQQQNKTQEINRWAEVILNFVLSPALIAFTILFYAYMGKIILIGELPKGMVANIALPYLIGGMLVYVLREACAKPSWQVFFRYFPYLAIVPIILLTFAVEQRISAYAWTENRIYLLAFTVAIIIIYGVLLLSKWRQYRWISAIIILTVFSMTWIINPVRIAYASQTARFEQLLDKLHLKDDTGQVRLDLKTEALKLNEQDRKDWQELSNIYYYLRQHIEPPQNTHEWYYDDREKALAQRYGAQITKLSSIRIEDDQVIMDGEILDNLKIKTFRKDIQSIDIQNYQTFYDIESHRIYRSELTKDDQSTKELCWINGIFCANIDQHIQAVFQAHGLNIHQQYDSQTLDKLMPEILILNTPQYQIYLDTLQIEFIENKGYQFSTIEGKWILTKNIE